VSRWLGFVVSVVILAGTSTAFTQSSIFIRKFGTPQRASVQAATRSEWSKISDPEIGCINGALRQNGATIETLIQRGVMPSDPRIGSIRSSCQQSPSGSRYVVAGLGLGSRVQFDSSDYREYKCNPSDQFDGFTWCQKTRQERGFANVTYSILHSQDGTVVYVNRFQEPAFFGQNEAEDAIRQHSTKLGEKAQIKKLPRQRGIPEGILATWGKVVLEPLDNDSIKTLAEGRSPKKGYLVDFIGNFARSAKEGLPIYRIGGGAGFLWVASFDPIGRGILRFAAVDPSASLPSSLPSDAGVTGLDVQPAGVERASNLDVVARQEAEKAKADVEVARNEADTAKRDAQAAKAEIGRLSAETAKLNAALERLEKERAAVEGKAQIMEFVAYGAAIILIALFAIVSSILFVNRRRALAKREAVEAETKPSEVTRDSSVVETPRASDVGDSQPAKTSDKASVSPDLAESFSGATAPKSQGGSGASDALSSSDTDEERVILPI
jgi:cell division protein FtsB